MEGPLTFSDLWKLLTTTCKAPTAVLLRKLQVTIFFGDTQRKLLIVIIITLAKFRTHSEMRKMHLFLHYRTLPRTRSIGRSLRKVTFPSISFHILQNRTTVKKIMLYNLANTTAVPIGGRATLLTPSEIQSAVALSDKLNINEYTAVELLKSAQKVGTPISFFAP